MLEIKVLCRVLESVGRLCRLGEVGEMGHRLYRGEYRIGSIGSMVSWFSLAVSVDINVV